MQLKPASKTIAFTTAIPFNSLITNLGQHTINGAITFTIVTTDAEPGYGSIMRLFANGTNEPNFSAFKKNAGSQEWLNTAGALNVIGFQFDGTDYWYTIVREANALPTLAQPSTSFDTITATSMRLVVAAAVPNATSYIYEISTSSTFANILQTTTLSTLNATFNSLAPSTQHYGRVRAAATGYNTSANSTTANAQTSASGGTTLATPANFVATDVSSSQINLTWDDVSYEQNYRILFNTTNNFGTATVLASPVAGAISYNHTGLAASTQYFYWLQAVGNGSTYLSSGYALANDTTQASGGGGSYQAESVTFFNVNTVLTSTQKTAVDNLCIVLKAIGLSKFTSVYMAIGSGLGYKLNFVNPANTNAAYRLDFIEAAPYSDANGIEFGPSGNGGYANTFINASLLYTDNMHMSFFSKTDVDGVFVDMGAFDGTYVTQLSTKILGGAIGAIKDGGSIVPQTSSAVYLIASRTSNTSRKLYSNGTEIENDTTNAAGGAFANLNQYLGGRNDNGTVNLRPGRHCILATWGFGLTPSEATQLNAGVQQYKIDLGR